MIYIDASVALAYLLDEHRAPSEEMWASEPASSQLLEYEICTRLNAYKASPACMREATRLVAGTILIDLLPSTLARLREPFPVELRTLDAIHVSTMIYLIGKKATVSLASYDARMNAAAAALGIPLYDLQ